MNVSLKKWVHIFSFGFSDAVLDLTIESRDKILGFLWYILEPLIFFFVILSLRQNLALGQDDFYPIYLFIGLAFFNFLRKATHSATLAISSNANYVKNMKIDVEPLVISVFFSALFMHMFEVIILVGLMIYAQIPIIHIFVYLLALIVVSVFVLGLCFILAALNVFIRDINNIWSIAIRILWFVTPVFYYFKPTNIISRINFTVNPLFHYLSSLRQSIRMGSFPSDLNMWSAIVFAILIFIFGIWFFGKVKNKFAENL